MGKAADTSKIGAPANPGASGTGPTTPVVGSEGALEQARKLQNDLNSQAPNPPVVPVPPVAATNTRYWVEEGKSVSTKRGILKQHQEIKPQYLAAKDARRQLDLMVQKKIAYKGALSRPSEEFRREEIRKAEAERKAATKKRGK